MALTTSPIAETLTTRDYPSLGVKLDCGSSDRGLTPTPVGLEVARFSRLLHGSVLDQGSGSGLQSIVAAKQAAVERVVGVDLNPAALALSVHNALKNGVREVCRFIDLQTQKAEAERFDSGVGNLPEIPHSPVFGRDGSEVQRHFLQETVPRHLVPGATLITKSVSYAADWKREPWVNDWYLVEKLAEVTFDRPHDVSVGPAQVTAEILKLTLRNIINR